jgi:hypothetical protein
MSIYREIEDLSRDLKLPVPLTLLTIEVRSPKGELEFRRHDYSHTWTRNYWVITACNAMAVSSVATNFGAGYLGIKDTAGAVSSISCPMGMNFVETTSASTAGIVIGTGTGSESLESYGLGTLIANGTGTGQMAYGSMSAPTPGYTSGSKTWATAFTRVMTNNSDGSITVNETGIVTKSSNTPANVLICRDKLGTGIAVSNGGGQILVTYTISLAFTA